MLYTPFWLFSNFFFPSPIILNVHFFKFCTGPQLPPSNILMFLFSPFFHSYQLQNHLCSLHSCVSSFFTDHQLLGVGFWPLTLSTLSLVFQLSISPWFCFSLLIIPFALKGPWLDKLSEADSLNLHISLWIMAYDIASSLSTCVWPKAGLLDLCTSSL